MTMKLELTKIHKNPIDLSYFNSMIGGADQHAASIEGDDSKSDDHSSTADVSSYNDSSDNWDTSDYADTSDDHD